MKKSYGSLEVICGPMFAGKTKELIHRIINEPHAQAFKPVSDTRSRRGNIVTHDGLSFPATPLASPRDIFSQLKKDTRIVAIDEAQFFGAKLIPATRDLLKSGYRVIIAGLSVMYDGKPYPPIPELMAQAEHGTKLTAECMQCGKRAAFHRRTAPTPRRITRSPLIGGAESYEAVCRTCFLKLSTQKV